MITILDCYTDEPAGLGVPPYIGTYPRYVAGAVLETKNQVFYLTIDDLRKHKVQKQNKKIKEPKKTNIKIKNLSKNFNQIEQILKKTKILIIICGIHTPGKYLSALPGTIAEVSALVKDLKCFKILSGPAAHSGSGLYGGKLAAKIPQGIFDLIIPDIEFKLKELIKNNFTQDVQISPKYKDLKKIAVLGSAIVKQHPDYPNFTISEIETSRGCPRKTGCSFCTEPLKYSILERRKTEDIVEEVKALHKHGIKYFRLGKQTCFYSYGTSQEIEQLLKNCRKYAKILHIDNANPAMVTEEKTKAIVKYCTEGNVAAFGVESFDPVVVKKNNLNSTPEQAYKAVEIINKYGADKGLNGMPKFLPGINLLYGLIGETKKTHEENLAWLTRILDDNLLLRRINIRQVVAFPGTLLYRVCGNKIIKKNKRYYWSWRKEIREKIDHEMLKRLVPENIILKNIRTEIWDGNTTFGRQIGTYPLIVGIKQKLELNKFINIKVVDYMLRSVVGEMI